MVQLPHKVLDSIPGAEFRYAAQEQQFYWGTVHY